MSPKRLLTLATPCAACPHPYNWHTADGCQADDGTNQCGCIAFAVAGPEPCAQHPTAPRIDGLCGGCTQYPTDTTPETRRA